MEAVIFFGVLFVALFIAAIWKIVSSGGGSGSFHGSGIPMDTGEVDSSNHQSHGGQQHSADYSEPRSHSTSHFPDSAPSHYSGASSHESSHLSDYSSGGSDYSSSSSFDSGGSSGDSGSSGCSSSSD